MHDRLFLSMQLEALFQRHSGSLARLVPALTALLGRPGSPAAVKCTKRLYNSVVKNTASVSSCKQGEGEARLACALFTNVVACR